MKKIFTLAAILLLIGNICWGYYDFLESPDEYERFKEFYDARNEFWKYFQKYEEYEPVIEYKNINRVHNERKVIIKKDGEDGELIIQ